MKPGGIALAILGFLVVCQVIGGSALERLNIVQ
jgi:hypothetical protein